MSSPPSKLARAARPGHAAELRRTLAGRVGASVGELSKTEKQFLSPALEVAETPLAPGHQVLLWTLVALTVSGLLWTYLGKIDVVSTSLGKVAPAGKLKVVQPSENAIVRAIHVKEGQAVKQGDLLVELDNSNNGTDLSTGMEKLQLARVELARLTAELNGTAPDYGGIGARVDMIALQEPIRIARESGFRAKLAEANSLWQGKEMALRASIDALRSLEETIKSVRENEARVRPYIGEVMSRFEYLKLKDNLTQMESSLAAQQSRVQEARTDVAAAQHRVGQLNQANRSGIMDEMNQRTALISSLRGDVDKTQLSLTQKSLRAPADGYVQSLSITTVGGTVAARQVIATIVPDKAPLIVEAMLSNEDIGFVKLGQAVDIKVDTFPFQKYGSLRGTVIWISPDAELQTDASGAQSGLKYKVQIKPERSTLNINGVLQPISTGMTVQVDIITDSRRIIELVLYPVLKSWNEGLRVR